MFERNLSNQNGCAGRCFEDVHRAGSSMNR
jgi:hypothetical protein